MNKWIAIGHLIERFDKNKRWVFVRKYVAHRIIRAYCNEIYRLLKLKK